ncbi:hypothetical protein BDB01DRAFT_61296 [Pilobolus umbonatus]|nr:hypothetical protein BDB01DRAFT_61296 [Pilobolus umbonatus]
MTPLEQGRGPEEERHPLLILKHASYQPMTISQLYKYNSDNILTSIVGVVLSRTIKELYSIYYIEDGTGIIEVRYMHDTKEDQIDIKPDTYVRVITRIFNHNNLMYYTAFHIRAIDDYNEITFHLLNAVYTHTH